PLAGLLALGRDERRLEAGLHRLASFAAGALLAGAFMHLLPEALIQRGVVPGVFLSLVAAFVGFFIIEKFLWHHGHRLGGNPSSVHPLATLNVLGDGLHNLIDGMVIAAAFASDRTVGIAATIAVIVHEVPQELGDFAVLVRAGVPVRRAILLNFLSGLAAVAGAVLTLAVGERVGGFTAALLPIAAGSLIYIAASDIVPELQHERTGRGALWQIGLMILGFALVSLPALLH
ncbi:MAG: ZIP family metal transporter, partial [Acidimicrobiales bacterium]